MQWNISNTITKVCMCAQAYILFSVIHTHTRSLKELSVTHFVFVLFFFSFSPLHHRAEKSFSGLVMTYLISNRTMNKGQLITKEDWFYNMDWGYPFIVRLFILSGKKWKNTLETLSSCKMPLAYCWLVIVRLAVSL